jgi:hypothetical protein
LNLGSLKWKLSARQIGVFSADCFLRSMTNTNALIKIISPSPLGNCVIRADREDGTDKRIPKL